MSVRHKNAPLHVAVNSVRVMLLMQSGSAEGSALFRKRTTAVATPLTTANQWPKFEQAWMKATAEIDKFAVIWHMASVLARKKYRVLPDRAKIAELDIKLDVLFADQEDMTASQRRQLDAIAQAFEAMTLSTYCTADVERLPKERSLQR